MSGPQTLGVDPLIALALVVAFTLLAALAWLALARRRHRVRQLAAHPLAAGDAGTTPPRKIVIFYSSIGHGHISAAHIAALAREMKLAMTEVFEVASFYHHFDLLREGQDAAALTRWLKAPWPVLGG